jgi:hypothetical protein
MVGVSGKLGVKDHQCNNYYFGACIGTPPRIVDKKITYKNIIGYLN